MTLLERWRAERNRKRHARFRAEMAGIRRQAAELRQGLTKVAHEAADRARARGEELEVEIWHRAGYSVEQIMAATGLDRRRVIDLVERLGRSKE